MSIFAEIIVPEPEPSGIYCQDKPYTWELDCPDAATIEWVVTSFPVDLIDEDGVYEGMFNRYGIVNCVTFPVSGKFCLAAKCCRRRPCHPFIDESEGKFIEIFCNDGVNVCGRAQGFFPGDDITLEPYGLTQILPPSGVFCFPVGAALDEELTITATGVNHNGCTITASTVSVVGIEDPPCPGQPGFLCQSFGAQVTYISGSQICGVVQDYVVGDVVEIVINGTTYQGVVFPDPNTFLPIWCVDVTPTDYLASVGTTLQASISNGVCSNVFPFVFV